MTTRLVVIAPDSFDGSLTARQAAEAIAAGWRLGAPDDQIALRPLSDGGPGFIDVLHGQLGGVLQKAVVSGPLGAPTTARWLKVEDTAYVESAQACGLQLVSANDRNSAAATSRGVGELLRCAQQSGCRTVVIGLGGTSCTDGGAGMLTALGAIPVDKQGKPLPDGGAFLTQCVELAGTAELAGLHIIVASDVDNPLLGYHGAARTFGPQKGADPEMVDQLDQALTQWALVLADATGRQVAEQPGAGAGGGLGAALLALGAIRKPGAALVQELVGFPQALGQASVVVTGEGSFDWQSLRGKVVSSVAQSALTYGVPVVVLAGQVSVGRREAAAVGVSAAYSVTDHVGSVTASLDDPSSTLSALAERTAGQWRHTMERS